MDKGDRPEQIMTVDGKDTMLTDLNVLHVVHTGKAICLQTARQMRCRGSGRCRSKILERGLACACFSVCVCVCVV